METEIWMEKKATDLTQTEFIYDTFQGFVEKNSKGRFNDVNRKEGNAHMGRVTLESQLETYAKEAPDQYEDLLTTWRCNKKRCESLLSSVSEQFIYYSSHSAEHSQMVIRNIERILDDSRIQLLSATDIWLILHSAYMHDLGMVIPYEDYKHVWTLPEFECFLKDNLHSDNSDLREASQFLIETLGKNKKWKIRENSPIVQNNENKPEITTVEDWPIVYRSSAAILISEYFRPKHADRIAKYLDTPSQYDMSFNILNNRRIVSLIKRVSCLHTRDSKELISTLEQETVGFGRDIAHPRFVAELLRLGDALDLDAGRFSIDFMFLHGKRPEYSELHYKLHNAVTDFLVKPQEVHYRADCPDRETYRLACQLTRYLEEEFHFCALNWPEIVPDNFPGPVPRFILLKDDIKFKGKPDDLGLTKLRFTLQEKKAFQLLEGANIYSGSIIFVRELLQNALDATKIQLWRDLKNRYDYKRRLPDGLSDNLSNLQPYDILPDLLENYPINIQIREIDKDNGKCPKTGNDCPQVGEETGDGNETTEILFTDHGTGFTVESVKRMCQVTESYSDPTLTNEINEMPLWLRPTGGFGIGLQSVFTISDTIDIDTQSEDGTHLSMKIESPHKRSGIVRVEIEDKPRLDGRGTTIKIRLKEKAKEEFDFSTFEMSVTSYAERLYGQIAQFFQKNCRAPLFPMTVKWKDASCSPEGMGFYALFKGELPDYNESKLFKDKDTSSDDKCGRYYYRLSKDGTQIEIWDTKDAWLAHWELSHRLLEHTNSTYFFKGMRTKEEINLPECWNFYACYRMDAHGLETSPNLQLNRSELTASGKKVSYKAIEETGNLYMEILWDKVRSALETSSDTPGLLERHNSVSSNTLLDKESNGCYRLAFWLSATEDVREKLSKQHSGWFKDTGASTRCLEMRSENCKVQNMPVEDYIKNYKALPRLTAPHGVYALAMASDDAGVQRIFSAFRQMNAPYSQCERILIEVISLTDKNLSPHSRGDYYTISHLPELVEKTVAVCGIAADYGLSILFPATTPSESNKYHTNSLCVNLLSKRNILCAKPQMSNAKRCYLPILPGYQSLALDKLEELKRLYPVNCGFYFPSGKIVISPVTSDDDDNIKKMSREDFQKHLAATESFRALVKYVAKHTKKSVNQEQIEKLYLKLVGEIWDARHEEAETETPNNADSIEASETVPDTDVLSEKEGESPS